MNFTETNFHKYRCVYDYLLYVRGDSMLIDTKWVKQKLFKKVIYDKLMVNDKEFVPNVFLKFTQYEPVLKGWPLNVINSEKWKQLKYKNVLGQTC